MTQSKTSSSASKSQDPGFVKVLTGTIISGGMSYLFIRLLMSILHNLPPIAIDGTPLARSLSIGVRYMLVGAIGLLAFMFTVVTVGLVAYIGQLAWQALFGNKSTDTQSSPNLTELVAEEVASQSTEISSATASSLDVESAVSDDSSGGES